MEIKTNVRGLPYSVCSAYLEGGSAVLALQIESFPDSFHKVNEIKVVTALEPGEPATGEVLELEPSKITRKTM